MYKCINVYIYKTIYNLTDFRNFMQEIAVREIQTGNKTKAMESFSLGNKAHLNLLIANQPNIGHFDLYWMLLGFSSEDVPVLLKNELTEKAIQTSILVGNSQEAVDLILKSKDKSDYHSELEEISSICLENKNTTLFLKIQNLLGRKSEVVDYFIDCNLDTELSNFIRKNTFTSAEKPLLLKIFDFFESKGDTRASWEVLLKLKDKRFMVQHSIKNKNFGDALKLLRESKDLLKSAELTVPLAEYLVYKSKFKEAYDLYKRINLLNKFEEIMKVFIRTEFHTKSYSALVPALRFLFKTYKSENYLVFLKFFVHFERIMEGFTEMQSMMSFLKQDNWKTAYNEYLSEENIDLNGTNYNRVSLLKSQIRYVLFNKQVTSQNLFGELTTKLKHFLNHTEAVSKGKFVALKNNKDKENTFRNFGSKKAFRESFKKQNTNNMLNCFLCQHRNSQMSSFVKDSYRCSNCLLNFSFCELSGVLLPLVVFHMDSQHRKSLLI